MSTVTVTVEHASQAYIIAGWLKSIRFVQGVNIHHDDRSVGNVNSVQQVLDSIQADNILAGIPDPVAYQKMIRNEWN